MGKKLFVGKYTFDASENKVVLKDNIATERLLLITDVTINKFIYNFSDPTIGTASRTYDNIKKETTFILDANCVSLGCADTDSLQVFVEEESTEVALGESFTDPVSKIRVSNPENLIDTDFEYGLQSTKWETLELTNNIPTFFARDGDVDIGLTSINVTAGSDIVTVTCSESHGLQRGSPIVLQSTGSVSADGGFIVAGVIDSLNFNFKAKSQLTVTDNIKETYTQLFPASIYTGTEFKLSQIGGITTDGAATSTLTTNTIAPTNFTTGTSMSLSNTFAKSTVNFQTDNIDIVNVTSFTTDVTNNTATGETDKFKLGAVSMEPFVLKEGSSSDTSFYRVPCYFEEGVDYTVNTSTNTIVFNQAHGLVNSRQSSTTYACPMCYIGDPTSNTAIGGLVYWQTYYVYVRSATEITIHYSRVTNGSTSYKMNLTGAGTSGGLVKSAFAPSKHIYNYSGRYSYYWSLNSPELYNGSTFVGYGSGYSAQANQKTFVTPIVVNSSGGTQAPGYLYYRPNSMDDLHLYYYSYWVYQVYGVYNRIRAGYNPNSYISGSWSNSGDGGLTDIENDNKRSTLWVPSHGLTTSDTAQPVTLTALTGTLPTGTTSGGTYIAVYDSANRLALNNTSGSQVNMTTYGSTNLEYRVSYTKANTTANTIEIPANTLNEGDAVTYTVGAGNTAIGGLVDGTTYYVAFKSGDKFKLSTQKNVYGANKVLTNTSTYWTNPSTDVIRITQHGFNDGDAIVYVSASPLPGLINNQIYWVNQLDVDTFSLHNSKADSLSNSNRVDIVGTSTGTSIYTRVYVIDLTSKPSGETHSFEADFVGAADGLYDVGTTATDQLSFTLPATTQIQARTVSVVAQTAFVANFDALYITNHGFITGDSVTYTTSGTTNISGLTSSTVYYIIRVNKDFIKFASTQANATLGTNLTLTETGVSAAELTGTITLQPTTIVGSFNGSGTVSFTAGSYKITGELTNFNSFFNKGDTFFVNAPPTTTTTAITNRSTNTMTAAGHTIVNGDMITFTGDAVPGGTSSANVYFGRNVTTDTFTAHYTRGDAIANSNPVTLSNYGTNASVNRIQDSGSLIERTIDYVNSDTQITVTEPMPATAQTAVNYLQNTSLLLRPDGFALHRPYDGGVELIPSTNPDSTMIRQTRKYFRYQSGKGIQVSFAVNFSPTSQIDTFTRSGSTGTVTTRFPHRLSAGLRIVTSGSTNSSNDAWGTVNVDVIVSQDLSGNNKYYINGVLETSYTLYEGRTYKFDQSDSSNTGHPLRFSTTDNGTHGGGVEYITGVTVNGTPGSAGAYTQIVVASSAPNLYVYCTAHSGMGLSIPTLTDPTPNTNLWNDEIEVASIVDDFTFTVTFNGTPGDNSATGVVEYYVKSWENSKLKCGLFDDQNGIFFEFDGNDLYCCRRSAIRQISGYANVNFRSNTMTGINTKFASQLAQNDMIVVKGQTYKISKVDSDTQVHLTPSYRGTSQEKVVVTKIETTAVRQGDWNLDPCDGTGYTGFILNPYKIQMAYIDYSWYGAGKVRFGFKDQNGDVKYVHSFTHGNEFTEAYMRSGNVPARYEIENIGQPTYVPALAHWGTSVIMDGRFDPDKAYIFNAPSRNITLTGVSQLTTNARVESTANWRAYDMNARQFRNLGYALTLQTGDASLNQVSSGLAVGGADLDTDTALANPTSNQLGSQPYQPDIYAYPVGNYSGGRGYRDMLVINKAPTGTSGSFTSYTLGAASGGEIQITKDVPLISIRLAPSVDTSAPGFLGEREIVNRMQLILQGVNILSTHAVNVRLVLNGQLSSNAWERVTPPSLSQLIFHENVDTISGGASVFNFDAQGGTGTNRTPALTTESLGDIATLGNSILGGDNVYPDGPDVLTLVATLSEDPSTVSGTTPFIVSGRVSWSESQA